MSTRRSRNCRSSRALFSARFPRTSASPATAASCRSGEGGIRTLDGGFPPYSLSRRVPSATRPPLRSGSMVAAPPLAHRGGGDLVASAAAATPEVAQDAAERPDSLSQRRVVHDRVQLVRVAAHVIEL